MILTGKFLSFFPLCLLFWWGLVTETHSTQKEVEKFYVFRVGQGNCQLAVYDGFGVLYDAGSASEQIPIKIETLHSEEGNLLFERLHKKDDVEENQNFIAQLANERIEKNPYIYPDAESLFQKDDSDSNSDGEKSPHSTRSSQSVGTMRSSTSTMSAGEARTINITPSIQKVIEENKIKHLFVFVSHPDFDHYNKLLNSLPPPQKDIKVTIFLGGDWLGDIDENSKKKVSQGSDEKIAYSSGESDTQLKKPRRQRIVSIRNLLNRKNTWVELPYYWGYKELDTHKISHDVKSDPPDKIHNYDDILSSFLHQTNEKKSEVTSSEKKSSYQHFKAHNFPNNPTKPFQGSLLHFIFEIANRIQKSEAVFDKQNMKAFQNHFKLLLTAEKQHLLEHITIWLMNQRFDDVNSQSTIVSFKMPTLNLRFICTGDAHDEVFYHSLFDTNFAKAHINQYTYDDNFLNVLIVPHHGSRYNISRRMMEIFSPSLFVISAGNGVKQHHPDKKTIEALKKSVRIGLTKAKFFDYYKEEKDPTTCISYENRSQEDKIDQKKPNKILINYLHKFSNKLPVLSTNVLGTIEFNQTGIKSDFSNLIEVETHYQDHIINQYFNINFRKRVSDREVIEELNKAMKNKSAQSRETKEHNTKKQKTGHDIDTHLIKKIVIEHDGKFYFPVKKSEKTKSQGQNSSSIEDNQYYLYYEAQLANPSSNIEQEEKEEDRQRLNISSDHEMPINDDVLEYMAEVDDDEDEDNSVAAKK